MRRQWASSQVINYIAGLRGAAQQPQQAVGNAVFCMRHSVCCKCCVGGSGELAAVSGVACGCCPLAWSLSTGRLACTGLCTCRWACVCDVACSVLRMLSCVLLLLPATAAPAAAGIVPTTNPTSTVIFKCLLTLKTRCGSLTHYTTGTCRH